jgi:hypothetical protein
MVVWLCVSGKVAGAYRRKRCSQVCREQQEEVRANIPVKDMFIVTYLLQVGPPPKVSSISQNSSPAGDHVFNTRTCRRHFMFKP